MINYIFLIGILITFYSGMHLWTKEINRVRFNNRVFNNRIAELKNIITDKDITYKARIEELLYMKNKYY